MRSTSEPHAMAELRAAKRSASDVAPIDLTYGFPGKLPTVGRGQSNTRLLQFFEQYVRIGDAQAAARAAGYSDSWAKQTSYKYLKEHREYVTWLQAHVAQQLAKQIGIDQEAVVRQIAAIAMANDYDYLVFEKDNGGKVLVRRKRLDELTREQIVAIEVTGGRRGKPFSYRFRDRDGKLFELGKSLGLFNERIILEHRHRHLHATVDLSRVPLERLEALEAQFEELLAIEDKGH